MQLYLQMFRTFFVIGGFTFGGGYAMLEMIREVVVDKRKWLTQEEFVDLFAVAQSLPGVFAVNLSMFIGYRLRKLPGAVVCALGTVLPCFVVMLLIAFYFTQIQNNEHVVRVFKGLRPGVVALIAAPVYTTWRTMKLGVRLVWIPIVTALLVWWVGVSPIVVILVAGLLGWMYVMFLKDKLNGGGTVQ